MKHMKKLLSFALALALCLGLAVPASAAQASFTDVKSGDWFYPYVTQLAQAGGVHGYSDGSFKPNSTITRAEVATIAVNLFPPDQIIAAECPQQIQDGYARYVEQGLANHWAKDAVWKVLVCIDEPNIQDVIDIRAWNQPATRSDIALILMRTYLQHMVGEGKMDPGAEAADMRAATLIGDYDKLKGTMSELEIVWMYSQGIVSGINAKGDYNPGGNATRAECCKIVVNLLDPSKRSKVDLDNIYTGDGKDFTGMVRARYNEDVAYEYCRALEEQIGIQIFYNPEEWTAKADGLFTPDDMGYSGNAHGWDTYYADVLAELKKMKAAFDLYPDGFLKEMAQKKGSRVAEIILCPYTFEGLASYGRYVYDYSSDAKRADRIYYSGKGDSQYYSHEMGHMVFSAASILNGWNPTCAAWEALMTDDGGSYISNYAMTSRPEDQAETWAYLWHQTQTVMEQCANPGMKAKVRYLTEIMDRNYSTFHAKQVPWASVLK